MEDSTNTPKSRLHSFPNWLFLSMVAILPPLHATLFSHSDALRTPIFVAAATLLFAFSGRSEHPIRLVRYSVLAFLAYLFLQAIFQGGADVWSIAPMLPLAAAAMVIGSRANQTRHPISYQAFATATSIGVLISAIFSTIDILAPGSLFPAIWVGPRTLSPFDNIEFAAPYYAMASMITLVAMASTKGWKRILFAITTAIAAIFTGTYLLPGVEHTYYTIAIIAGPISLLIYYLGKKNQSKTLPSEILKQRQKKLYIQTLGAFAIMGIAFASSQIIPAYREEPKQTQSIIGDVHWATNFPSISTQNNPILKGVSLQTNFSAGRWEMRPTETDTYPLVTQIAQRQLANTNWKTRLFGAGPNAWWKQQTSIYKNYPELAGKDSSHYSIYRTAHQSYYQQTIEFGFIGVFLFLAILFIPYILTILSLEKQRKAGTSNNIQEHPNNGIDGYVYAMITGLFYAAFTPVFELSAPLLLLSACVAMMLQSGYQKQQEETKKKSLVFDFAAALLIFASGLYFTVNATKLLNANMVRSQGDQNMLLQQYTKAKSDYEHAIAIAGPSGELLYNIALCSDYLRISKNLDKDIALIQQAEKESPYDARFYALHAKLLAKKQQEAYQTENLNDSKSLFEYSEKIAGRQKESLHPEEFYNKALDYNPNDVNAYRETAHINIINNEPKKAVKLLEEGLKRHITDNQHCTLSYEISKIYIYNLSSAELATPFIQEGLKYCTEQRSINDLRLLDERSKLELGIQKMKKEGAPVPKEMEEKLEHMKHHDHSHELF